MESIVLEIESARGEISGQIRLNPASIQRVGRTGKRASIDFAGGLVYVTDPDRLIEAMLHRAIADQLELEAAEKAKESAA